MPEPVPEAPVSFRDLCRELDLYPQHLDAICYRLGIAPFVAQPYVRRRFVREDDADRVRSAVRARASATGLAIKAVAAQLGIRHQAVRQLIHTRKLRLISLEGVSPHDKMLIDPVSVAEYLAKK